MNIEIKFKAKTLSTNDWVFGDLHLLTKFPHIHDREVSKSLIHTETIGQFTGLTDKNGKDIYQHDILQLQGKEKKYNCLVDWNINLGAWCISIENKCVGVIPLGEWLREDRFIVIGNIFDNPELLEE